MIIALVLDGDSFATWSRIYNFSTWSGIKDRGEAHARHQARHWARQTSQPVHVAEVRSGKIVRVLETWQRSPRRFGAPVLRRK